MDAKTKEETHLKVEQAKVKLLSIVTEHPSDPFGELQYTLEFSFSTAPWTELPYDCLMKICHYISLKDEVMMSRTCKDWHDFLSDKIADDLASNTDPTMKKELELVRRQNETTRLKILHKGLMCGEKYSRLTRWLVWWLQFCLPAIASLALGVIGIVYFHYFAGQISVIPTCDEASVFNSVKVVGVFLMTTGCLFIAMAVSIVHSSWQRYWISQTRGLSNFLILAFSLLIIAASVTGLVRAHDCHQNDYLSFSGNAYFAVTLAFGTVQLCLAIFFACVFKADVGMCLACFFPCCWKIYSHCY